MLKVYAEMMGCATDAWFDATISPMENHFLYPLFRKLRPDQAQREGLAALEPFVEFFITVYLSPIAVVGLVWLVRVSDFNILVENWLPFMLLAVCMYFVQKKTSTIPVEFQPGRTVTIHSSLNSVVLWSGLLIWGPTVLWVNILTATILRLEMLWQRSRFQQELFWRTLAYYIQDIAGSLLSTLLALLLYEAVGGKLPFSAVEFRKWIIVVVVILVDTLLTSLITVPIMIQLNRLISPNQSIRKELLSVVLSISAASLNTTPFAVLFALLYTRGNLGTYVFGLLCIFLVNQLAYFLSQTNLRSRQSTREMTQLESLGQAIIQAPPDGSTLVDLLRTHIPRMFPDEQDILEIHLFDQTDFPGFMRGADSLNLTHPQGRAPIPVSIWDDLKNSEDPHIVVEDVVLPGMKAVYGDAIIDKMTDAAPLAEGETPQCIGGVYLLRHKSVARTSDSLPAVQALASQIASALYRAQSHAEMLAKQKMTQELEFAGNIQASFLPEDVPRLKGWEIAASLTPAQQTAGDFYDFIPVDENKLGIVVADVADKGTGAALYMALSRTLIRTYAMDYPDQPAEALRLANERILADTRANQFVTVFYGVLDTITGEITYCNAGHNPAYILRNSGSEVHEPYIRTGPPMGIFGDIEWETGTAHMNPDDAILIYSDGVTEAQNTAGDFFKDVRLLEMGKANLTQPASEIHQTILDEVDRFVGEAPQFDDITLIVVKRLEQ